MKRLALAHFVILWLGCGGPSVSLPSAEQPLITVCAPASWTPTAAPPMTGWCMWQPSYRISPVEMNMRMCDIRWPPGLGEVNAYDLPFTNGAPQAASQCATLNDRSGGWFDWIAFQDYGWVTTTGSIRALQLGPGTKIIFSDEPLDVSRPDGCRIPSTCIGVGGNPTIVTNVPDVRAIFPGFPTFNMASLHIERQ